MQRDSNGFLLLLDGENTACLVVRLLAVERDLQAALKVLFTEPFISDRSYDALHCLACLADDEFDKDTALDILTQF